MPINYENLLLFFVLCDIYFNNVDCWSIREDCGKMLLASQPGLSEVQESGI